MTGVQTCALPIFPVVEVHISNTHAREGFRHVSLIAPVCLGQVTGLGRAGYTAAVDLLLDHIAAGGKTN